MAAISEYELAFSAHKLGNRTVIAGDHEGANVTVYNAPKLRELLDAQIGDAACKEIVVDFSRAGFLDSTGLGALVMAHSLATEQEKQFALYVPGERILKLLQITGLDGVFTLLDQPPLAPDSSQG